MPDVEDLVQLSLDQKPIEFQQLFNDILLDRINSAVSEKKIEMSKSIFNPDVEESPEPEEEEPEENPEDV